MASLNPPANACDIIRSQLYILPPTLYNFGAISVQNKVAQRKCSRCQLRGYKLLTMSGAKNGSIMVESTVMLQKSPWSIHSNQWAGLLNVIIAKQ